MAQQVRKSNHEPSNVQFIHGRMDFRFKKITVNAALFSATCPGFTESAWISGHSILILKIHCAVCNGLHIDSSGFLPNNQLETA